MHYLSTEGRMPEGPDSWPMVMTVTPPSPEPGAWDWAPRGGISLLNTQIGIMDK